MSEAAVKMSGNDQITFIAPDGSDQTAPDPIFLRDLILMSGDDYWQSGAGDAALWFDREDGKRARLIIMEDETSGFFLLYEHPESGDYFCPEGSQESEQSVTIYMGGEPMEINARHFLSKDQTWQTVEYFMKAGERNPALDWQVWQ
jgi:hypothetical protein